MKQYKQTLQFTTEYNLKGLDAIAKEIADIYQVDFNFDKTTKKTGWFSKEYEDCSLPSEDVDDLAELGFIADKENIPGIDCWEDDYSFDGASGYATFAFDVIIKHYIPDFEWDIYEIPNEKTLDCLDGNGYGLFCL